MHNEKNFLGYQNTGMDTYATFREDLCSQAIVKRKLKEIHLVYTKIRILASLVDEYILHTLENMQSAVKIKKCGHDCPSTRPIAFHLKYSQGQAKVENGELP